MEPPITTMKNKNLSRREYEYTGIEKLIFYLFLKIGIKKKATSTVSCGVQGRVMGAGISRPGPSADRLMRHPARWFDSKRRVNVDK